MRLLGLSFLLVLALASPAQAGWRMDRALAIAQTVWHPTCGQLRLSFGQPPEGLEGALGWAWSGDCTVRINQNERWQGFEPFCQTVLHEAGHAAGMGHTDHGIMQPRMIEDVGFVHRKGRVVKTWPGLDRRCRERGRPYLEAHGLL